MVLGFSKLLKSYLDFIVGKGSVVVGIKFLESLSGHFVINTSFVLMMMFFTFFFSSKVADMEVLEDSVGKFPELMFVNFTWGLGVDLCTGLLNPFPFSVGNCMVLGFSKLLKSYLDFIVGKGSVVVGIKFLESLSGHFVINTAFLSCLVDSDCRSGSKKCSNCEFHD